MSTRIQIPVALNAVVEIGRKRVAALMLGVHDRQVRVLGPTLVRFVADVGELTRREVADGPKWVAAARFAGLR